VDVFKVHNERAEVVFMSYDEYGFTTFELGEYFLFPIYFGSGECAFEAFALGYFVS